MMVDGEEWFSKFFLVNGVVFLSDVGPLVGGLVVHLKNPVFLGRLYLARRWYVWEINVGGDKNWDQVVLGTWDNAGSPISDRTFDLGWLAEEDAKEYIDAPKTEKGKGGDEGKVLDKVR